MHIAEEYVATCLDGWAFAKIDMVRNFHELCVSVKHLNTNLAAVCKQVSGYVALKAELCDAKILSTKVEARLKSVGEQAKAVERHLEPVAQKVTVAQAKLTREKSPTRAFEPLCLSFSTLFPTRISFPWICAGLLTRPCWKAPGYSLCMFSITFALKGPLEAHGW